MGPVRCYVLGLVLSVWAAALASPESEGDVAVVPALGRASEGTLAAQTALRRKVGYLLAGGNVERQADHARRDLKESRAMSVSAKVYAKKAEQYAAQAADHRLVAARHTELATKEGGNKQLHKAQDVARGQIEGAKELAAKDVRAKTARFKAKTIDEKIRDLEQKESLVRSKEIEHKSKLQQLVKSKRRATLEWETAQQETDRADDVLAAARRSAAEARSSAVRKAAASVEAMVAEQNDQLGEEAAPENSWGDAKCEKWVKKHPTYCKYENYKKNCAKSCHDAQARGPAPGTSGYDDFTQQKLAALTPPKHLEKGAQNLKEMARIQQLAVKETAAKNVEKRASTAKVKADTQEHDAKLQSKVLLDKRRMARDAVQQARRESITLGASASEAEAAFAATKRAIKVSMEAQSAEDAAHETKNKIPEAKAAELSQKRHVAIEEKVKAKDLEKKMEQQNAEEKHEAEQAQRQAQQTRATATAEKSIRNANAAAEQLGTEVSVFRDLQARVEDLRAVHTRAEQLAARMVNKAAEADTEAREVKEEAKQKIENFEVRMATTTQQDMRDMLLQRIKSTQKDVKEKEAYAKKTAEDVRVHKTMVQKAKVALDRAQKQADKKEVQMRAQKALFDVSKKHFAKAFTAEALQHLDAKASGNEATPSKESLQKKKESEATKEIADKKPESSQPGLPSQKIKNEVIHESYKLAMPRSPTLAESQGTVADSAASHKATPESASSSSIRVTIAKNAAKLASSKAELLKKEAEAAVQKSEDMNGKMSSGQVEENEKAAEKAKESFSKAKRSAATAASKAAKSAGLAAAAQHTANEAKEKASAAITTKYDPAAQEQLDRVVHTAEAARTADQFAEAQATNAKVDEQIAARAESKSQNLHKTATSLSSQADATVAFVTALKSARQSQRAQDKASEAKGKATAADHLAKASLAKAAAEHAENLAHLYTKKAQEATEDSTTDSEEAKAHMADVNKLETLPDDDDPREVQATTESGTRARIATILSGKMITNDDSQPASYWVKEGAKFLKQAQARATRLQADNTKRHNDAELMDKIADEKESHARLVQSDYLQSLSDVHQTSSRQETDAAAFNRKAVEARQMAQHANSDADSMMVSAHEAVALAHQAQKAFRVAEKAASKGNVVAARKAALAIQATVDPSAAAEARKALVADAARATKIPGRMILLAESSGTVLGSLPNVTDEPDANTAADVVSDDSQGNVTTVNDDESDDREDTAAQNSTSSGNATDTNDDESGIEEDVAGQNSTSSGNATATNNDESDDPAAAQNSTSTDGTNSTESEDDKAVSKAHKLRQDARKKLEAAGLPIPSSLKKGGLQKSVDTEQTDTSLDDSMQKRVKIARELRKKARDELRKSGKPIPDELKKGSLDSLQNGADSDSNSTDNNSTDSASDPEEDPEDAAANGRKTKGSEKYQKHKIETARELREKARENLNAENQPIPAGLEKGGLKKFVKNIQGNMTNATEDEEDEAVEDEKIQHAHELRRKARANLANEGLPIPPGLQKGGLKNFKKENLMSAHQIKKHLAAAAPKVKEERLIQQLALAFRYRLKARQKMVDRGVRIPDQLRAGALEEQLKKQGIAERIISQAKMDSTMTTALIKGEEAGKAEADELPEAPIVKEAQMSLEKAMEVGPADLVENIKSKTTEEKKLMEELAVLHQRLHSARKRKAGLKAGIQKEESQEVETKQKVKERTEKNTAAQNELLHSSAKDERLHKTSMAKMSSAERRFAIKAQLDQAKKNERQVKQKISKLPEDAQGQSISELMSRENKVKKDLLYRAKNGKHLILRIASTNFRMKSSLNKYYRGAINFLHTLDGNSKEMVQGVQLLAQQDDVIIDEAQKLIATDSMLIQSEVKEDLKSLSAEVSMYTKRLEKAVHANRVADLQVQADTSQKEADVGNNLPPGDSMEKEQEGAVRAAKKEDVIIQEDEVKEGRAEKEVYNAYDRAIKKHVQLHEEVSRIMSRLAQEGRIEHKIPISNEEIRAAQWKEDQADKDAKRLKNELSLLRKLPLWTSDELTEQLKKLYAQMSDGYETLRVQLDELQMEPHAGMKPLLKQYAGDLKTRQYTARDEEQKLNGADGVSDPQAFVSKFVHASNMQSCVTKEIEILTTMFTLNHTKSEYELGKNKHYLVKMEISLQKEMNVLMLRKEDRLRKEVKKLYVKKLQRMDGESRKINSQAKQLKSRYMFHIKREKIVHMYEEMQKKHKEEQEKVESLKEEMKGMSKKHENIRKKYDDKILGIKAAHVVEKFEEMSTKRDALKDQVKKLQKLTSGKHSPSELRYIVSKYVTTGDPANLKRRESMSEVEKKLMRARSASDDLSYESHSEEKRKETLKKLEEKVKAGVMSAEEAKSIAEKIGAKKVDQAALDAKIDAIEKEEEQSYQKTADSASDKENARLRAEVEALKMKLEGVADKNKELKHALKQQDANAQLEKHDANENEAAEHEAQMSHKHKITAAVEKAIADTTANHDAEVKKLKDKNKELKAKAKLGKFANEPDSAEKSEAQKDEATAEEAIAADSTSEFSKLKPGSPEHKAHIDKTVNDYKKSEAKVAAMRAEIMTLKARKAAMMKQEIKQRLKPENSAEAQLRESKDSGTDIRSSLFGHVQVGDQPNERVRSVLDSQEMLLDVGESESRIESVRAQQLASLDAEIVSREMHLRELQRDLKMRAHSVHMLSTTETR